MLENAKFTQRDFKNTFLKDNSMPAKSTVLDLRGWNTTASYLSSQNNRVSNL